MLRPPQASGEPLESANLRNLLAPLFRRDGRRTHVSLFGRETFTDPALRPDDCLIADFDMPNHTDLASKRDVIAEAGTPGDADLGDDDAVLSNHHVVGDLDQIVDFRPFLNPSSPKPGTINRHIRPDFDVIIDLDDADLRDLHVPAGNEFETETVAPKDGAAVNDDAIPDEAARPDGDARMKETARPDAGHGRCKHARR